MIPRWQWPAGVITLISSWGGGTRWGGVLFPGKAVGFRLPFSYGCPPFGPPLPGWSGGV